MELAEQMFNAYNAAGPNPGKTWDGKDVPAWSAVGDQVQAKWRAAAAASQAEVWCPGAKVSWHLKDGTPGHGTLLSHEEDGHVIVAIDSDPGELHHVIRCATTWLTVDQAAPVMPSQPSPPAITNSSAGA